MTPPGTPPTPRCPDPVLSTIVLNWNRADLLRTTIQSYLDTVTVAFELIVVDNASTDDSRDLIRDLRAAGRIHHALLREENLGGEALNLGMSEARGRYLHVSENDIEYLPGWDVELLSKFAAFPELGQLSPFSPFYQVERGEIWADKPASPLSRGGRTIYAADENVGTTCVLRREVWDRGTRWGTYGSNDVRLPDDGRFSADVKALGYRVAWNDRYVAINWGHNIEEMVRRLPYYLANYRAKDWFGLKGFRTRLRSHGYELVEDEGATYRILRTDLVGTDPAPFADPNRYAPSPRVELRDDSVTVHGYQTFLLTRHTVRALPDDRSLQRKQVLLEDYFHPRYLREKSFLDLGANAGFFCFWSLQSGARRAVALDLDGRYLDLAERAAAHLAFHGLRTANANLVDWTEPCDVVIALALIHWIYSCTAFFGSLDAVVGKLAQLTRYMLVVEWIAPEDEAIQFFRHLDRNAETIREPYTLAAFEAALGRHFARYEVVGEVSPTRRIYVAFSTDDPALCPLPLTWPVEKIVSQRLVAVVNGQEYWSRVYDLGDTVDKQATDDLAEREFQFLSRLQGAYFPRALRAQRHGGCSVVTLEKVQGSRLQDVKADVAADAATLHAFVQHSLTLLGELRARGIVHRDIRVDNILVRDSRPVLIDFGWATSEHAPCPAPPRLGKEGRPPDGSFRDVYSMGRVFEELNDRRYPVLGEVVALMTDRDPSLRVSDVDVLKTLFTAAAVCEAGDAATVRGTADNPVAPPTGLQAYAAAIRELLAQISQRNQQLQHRAQGAWAESLRAAVGELTEVTPSGSLLILVDEDQGIRGGLAERRCVPFLERDGQYWGPPPDDATAVAEFERLRGSGAAFMVFTWPAFWWLDYYAGLHAHLRSTSRCVLRNDRLVVFDLRESAASTE